MNKHEKKFHNTHTKICQAVLELIEITEYEDISISVICKQAQINRSTFYSHFQNIAEILDIINSGLWKKFIHENDISVPQFNLNTFPRDSNLILNRQDLLKFLTFIKKHLRLYTIIVKHQNLLHIEFPEKDIKNNVFIPSMANLEPLSDNMLDYIFDFYVAGIKKILTKWISNGCIEDEHDVMKIIDVCLYKK